MSPCALALHPCAGACAGYPSNACRYSQAELEALDNQGRCIITDHHAFVLFNLYLPALTGQGQDDKASEHYRHKLRMLQACLCHCSMHRCSAESHKQLYGGRKGSWAEPASDSERASHR